VGKTEATNTDKRLQYLHQSNLCVVILAVTMSKDIWSRWSLCCTSAHSATVCAL